MHDAVRELARVLGVSQTSAVEVAVRAKLAELHVEHQRIDREKRIRQAVAEWQAIPGMEDLPDPDFLYDPGTGLPRCFVGDDFGHTDIRSALSD
ncbi:type II toxin-antitoxin system VapB family antitoxin [Microbacterium pumilum]|uniref:Uncharacterized protein n=1 Tax=Microbacterium pumilum TaxID=344165 RepID=A0ABN2S241_9MICO